MPKKIRVILKPCSVNLPFCDYSKCIRSYRSYSKIESLITAKQKILNSHAKMMTNL